MAETVNFEIYKGTAVVLTIPLTHPENVSGWSTKLFVRDKINGNTVLALDGAIANVSIGVFTVTMPTSNTNTLTFKTYAYSFERTNTGAEDVLTVGQLKVLGR